MVRTVECTGIRIHRVLFGMEELLGRRMLCRENVVASFFPLKKYILFSYQIGAELCMYISHQKRHFLLSLIIAVHITMVLHQP